MPKIHYGNRKWWEWKSPTVKHYGDREALQNLLIAFILKPEKMDDVFIIFQILKVPITLRMLAMKKMMSLNVYI